MDIFEQLGIGNIPAVQEFQAEPLAIVPASQRVQQFLAEIAGPAWLSARVTSYPLPGGVHVHMASASMPLLKGMALIVVAEALDGSLSLPSPRTADGDGPTRPANAMQIMADGHTPEQAQVYSKERDCLDKILPALTEVGRILAADETVKPRRKKRLLGQLNHASGHLLQYLEDMLPGE